MVLFFYTIINSILNKKWSSQYDGNKYLCLCITNQTKSNMTLLDINPINLYPIVKHIHSVISVTFLIAAVWLIYRSIKGITKSISYSQLDKILSYVFLVNMYLQLIFGLILFTNFGSFQGFNYIGTGNEELVVSKRLWPIEHIVLMIFALFIANLGLIFSSKSGTDRDKHSKILLYYSISMLLIIVSLGAIYLL